MKLKVSQNLYKLAKSCPFPLYIVGGYVRDSLLGLAPQDIDISAPCSAEKFLEAAKACGGEAEAVYKNTGTVKLNLCGEKMEFSAFRSDEYVRGVHSPVRTYFTDDITLDAKRRDFKCNAVYYDIAAETFCDPLGGMEDIGRRLITTVADADKVFGEDGLRLMRLARQAAQLNFTPSPDCLEGAGRNAELILDISAERIYAELDAILHADGKYGFSGGQYGGLKILEKTRVLDKILPELTLGRGMAQNAAFHKFDVLEHSLRSVLYASDGVRLASLLHDVGKPRAFIEGGNYHNHEVIGAEIAENILSRLKVPKKLAQETVRLCALHMYDFRCDARESKIRKFIVKNNDVFEKLLLLKQADYSACMDDGEEAPCVKKWNKIYKKMISEGAPMTVKALAVRGDELKRAGVPDRLIAETLDALLTECALNPSLNNKKYLLDRVEKEVARGKFI